MPRTGRPKLAISQDYFEDLCSILCTETEIASLLKVSVDTLERWCKRTYQNQTFAEAYKRLSDSGKESLRRAQFKTALDGNPTMQIWLGKQILEQRDKQDLEVRITDDREIAEAALQPWLDAGYSRQEAIEQCKQHVPEVAKLASELVQ